MKFNCQFCGREMKTTVLGYKSNSFCNKCFDERAALAFNDEESIVKYLDNMLKLFLEGISSVKKYQNNR